MPKYHVTMTEKATTTYEVEASDSDAAEEAAREAAASRITPLKEHGATREIDRVQAIDQPAATADPLEREAKLASLLHAVLAIYDATDDDAENQLSGADVVEALGELQPQIAEALDIAA